MKSCLPHHQRILMGAMFMAFGFLFSTCEKTKEDPPLEGTYSGKFSVTYNHQEHSWHDTTYLEGDVTVTFSNDSYVSSSNSRNTPAGGRGDFIKGYSTITFVDQGIWQDDFDHNLILSGTYEYFLEDKSLKLIKTAALGTYEYQLLESSE